MAMNRQTYKQIMILKMEYFGRVSLGLIFKNNLGVYTLPTSFHTVSQSNLIRASSTKTIVVHKPSSDPKGFPVLPVCPCLT